MAQQKDKGENRRLTEIIIDLGKVPPQCIDLEEAVLAALLLEGESIYRIPELKPEHFYKEANQKIFKAIMSFEGKNCDLLTVVNKLRDDNELDEVGGPYYLSTLTNKVSSSVHLEYHKDVILEKFMSRECIRIGNDIQQAAFENDLDIISEKANLVHDVLTGSQPKKAISNADIGNTVVQRIIEINEGENAIKGIPTKYELLDRLIYGLNAPDLIIVAGRPSMGKTAFAIGVGIQVAEQGIPVAMFSLEMNASQLYIRELSFISEINSRKFNISGGLTSEEKQELWRTKTYLDNAPFYVDDTPGISIHELRLKARRMAAQLGIKVIIVDYIQLMKGEQSGSREQEISSITRGLKTLAMELDIPIIAISQLSRKLEDRSDKKPKLSDLRESGAIEQDADIVIFPWRPEVFGITHLEGYDTSEGKAIIAVAKHRNGSTGDLIMGWEKKYAKFYDLTEDSITKEEHVEQTIIFDNDDDDKPF